MLKILGYTYAVDRSKNRDEIGAFGRCDSLKLKIQIANDLAPEQIQSTVIHEILEAIDFSLELKIDHQTMCAIEVALRQALIDNGVDLTPLEHI